MSPSEERSYKIADAIMSTFHTDDLLSLRELGQEDHNPSTDPDSTMVEQTAEGPSFEMFPETFPSDARTTPIPRQSRLARSQTTPSVFNHGSYQDFAGVGTQFNTTANDQLGTSTAPTWQGDTQHAFGLPYLGFSGPAFNMSDYGLPTSVPVSNHHHVAQHNASYMFGNQSFTRPMPVTVPSNHSGDGLFTGNSHDHWTTNDEVAPPAFTTTQTSQLPTENSSNKTLMVSLPLPTPALKQEPCYNDPFEDNTLVQVEGYHGLELGHSQDHIPSYSAHRLRMSSDDLDSTRGTLSGNVYHTTLNDHAMLQDTMQGVGDLANKANSVRSQTIQQHLYQPGPTPITKAVKLDVQGVDLTEGSGRTDFVYERRILSTEQTLRYREGDTTIDADTIFGSTEEANEWSVKQGMTENNTDDTTMPKTDEQKKAIVKNLVKAFKSIYYAKDSDGIKKPFIEQRHENHRVEYVCWHILNMCIRREVSGPLLVAFDQAKCKSFKDRYANFAQRMDEIIVSMKCYKTICKHLYDAPYIATFIDAPTTARNRVDSNKLLNARKGEQIQAGKRAEPSLAGPPKRRPTKRSRVKQEESEDEEDFDELAIEDSPADYATPLRPQRPAAMRSRAVTQTHTNAETPSMGDLDSPSPATFDPTETPLKGLIPGQDYFISPGAAQSPASGHQYHFGSPARGVEHYRSSSGSSFGASAVRPQIRSRTFTTHRPSITSNPYQSSSSRRPAMGPIPQRSSSTKRTASDGYSPGEASGSEYDPRNS